MSLPVSPPVTLAQAPFAHVQQDENADNPGDFVKLVLDDAARPFVSRGRNAWLIDSHAGAGCYAVRLARARPSVVGESYFADMSNAVVPRLVAAGLMVQPRLPKRGKVKSGARTSSVLALPTPPSFVGIAPMLLHRYPTLVRYEGFETKGAARQRLTATLRALGQHGTPQAGDGWAGSLSALRAAGDRDVVLFLDPMHFNRPDELDALRRVLVEAQLRSGSTLLAIFIPGTFSKRIRAYLEWKPAEDLVRAWASTTDWNVEGFHVRASLAATAPPSEVAANAGRRPHYTVILVSDVAAAIDAARSTWHRRRRDSAFVAWTDV